MLNNEMLIKRLSLIKYLYTIGIEQSRQVEPIAGFSILSLHDSIEMFLKLLSEHHNIKSDKFQFLDFWLKIPSLTLKESMRNLNARRVNIKHKGFLPSKADIEISRVNAIDFFEQNTLQQFGIEFKDISLLSLIQYDNVRLHLEEAQNALYSNQFEICIDKAAIAFDELLNTYENSKLNYFIGSPFFFGNQLESNTTPSIETQNCHEAGFLGEVKNSLTEIQKALKIISFGIDYKRFAKFKMLTPKIRKTANGSVAGGVWGKKKWDKINCQYCIDFVLECALKFQEFDFDINEIQD